MRIDKPDEQPIVEETQEERVGLRSYMNISTSCLKNLLKNYIRMNRKLYR